MDDSFSVSGWIVGKGGARRISDVTGFDIIWSSTDCMELHMSTRMAGTVLIAEGSQEEMHSLMQDCIKATHEWEAEVPPIGSFARADAPDNMAEGRVNEQADAE